MVKEHSFVEFIKAITGLPPFHNFCEGSFTKNLDDAQQLVESANSFKCRFSGDVIDVMYELGNKKLNGYYVLCGNTVFFENENDALMFKLTF